MTSTGGSSILPVSIPGNGKTKRRNIMNPRKLVNNAEISEKRKWTLNYKIDFVEKNGNTVNDIHEKNQHISNVEFIINSAVDSITGGINTKKHREFVEQMNNAKKVAFSK